MKKERDGDDRGGTRDSRVEDLRGGELLKHILFENAIVSDA